MILWRKYFLFLFFIFSFSKVFAEKQAKVVLHFKNFDVLNFVKITDDKNKILYWDETQKQNALFEIELSSPKLLKLFVNDTMDFQAFWIEEGMNEANFTNNIHSYKFFDAKINDEFITIQRNIKWYEIQYQGN